MQSLDAPAGSRWRPASSPRWPGASASFAFATLEGAQEALDTLERHLATTPQT